SYWNDSISIWRQTLAHTSHNGRAHYQLGNALKSEGRLEEALTHYVEAVRIMPDAIEAQNNLAWFWATCHLDGLRDGRRALELADKAARSTGYENPSVLDSLAAAYAETGDFQQAITWQERAVALAPDQAKAMFLPRLELYRQRKPFREADVQGG